MGSEITITKQSFRTDRDNERSKRAAEVVQRMQSAVDSAQSAVDSTEAACAEDPTEKNFSKAREARRSLEDARASLELAGAHASKIESEVRANEEAAIRAEIARRQAALCVVDDEAMRVRAAELGVICCEIRTATEARAVQRRKEIDEINALKARIGEKAEDAPLVEKMIVYAFKSLAEIGLSVQAQCGTPWRAMGSFPGWRETNLGGVEVQEFLSGTERITDAGTWINPETGKLERRITGRDGTSIAREAATLLARVKAKHASLAPSGGISAKTAAAAVGLLAALASISLAGG